MAYKAVKLTLKLKDPYRNNVDRILNIDKE